MAITILCLKCKRKLSFLQDPKSDMGKWICNHCGYEAKGTPHFVDFLGNDWKNDTSDHYTLQWGEEVNFLGFIQGNPKAKKDMASARLGWDQMFSEIRMRAETEKIYVYDAACGYGGLANELFTSSTSKNLVYVGADIHQSLPNIYEKINDFSEDGLLLRWDIAEPLPVQQKFDYILCRAALHHTPDPRKSFSSLCSFLKPGGRIAISVYNKKAICREASDDALRTIISNMNPQEAFETCQQFTILGKALQNIEQKIEISEDLPLLGLAKGEISVHNLLYYHFLKCFYNKEFGEKYSTIVNYDWYHPQFAYRYAADEVKMWFDENKIRVRDMISIDVQHYIVGESEKV